VGGRKEDYDAVGADWSQRRLAKLEHNCNVMRQVWRGEKVVETALRIVEPLPVQSGGPSILSGSIGPKSIAAAARFSDGLSGFSLTGSLDEISNSFQQMNTAWQQAGRAGKPRLIASFWYGIEAAGKQKMLQHLQRYMNFMPAEIVDMLLLDAGFNGSIAELKDFITEIKALGADDIILVPTNTSLDELDELSAALF
jgi:alkanesulfonate monooxygenase SsuD/methylene tetrahydromethanopterin reductase-like flavin-dependent oxidoreductase (luciferase family)